MCAEGAASGLTLKDGNVYASELTSGCQRVLGRLFFEPKQFEHLSDRGVKLLVQGLY